MRLSAWLARDLMRSNPSGSLYHAMFYGALERLIEVALNRLGEVLPKPFAEWADDDWDTCEGCSSLLTAEAVHRDSQGVALCDLCFDNLDIDDDPSDELEL